MKKRLFLFFILLLMALPISANAAPTAENNSVKCSKINSVVEEYNTIEEKLESLTCSNTSDNKILKECNENNIKKSYLLSKLFKMNDDYPECKTARLEKVIKANEDNCHSVLDSSIKDIADKILVAFYILAPFLLIIFGSLDFTKIVVNQDPKEVIRLRKNFVKRLIATVGVYALPFIINFIVNMNLSSSSLDGNVYACKRDLNYSYDTWETVYVPKSNARSNSGSGNLYVNSQGTQAILDAAAQIHEKYKSEEWTYSTSGLSYGNIKRSLELSAKVTCCATYVGQTFYLAGIFTEEEINGYGYNSAPSTYRFLRDHNWIRIDNYDDLQPGDIVFEYMQDHGYPGHVQIYYGEGKWYNAGSTNAIGDYDGRTSPYSSNDRSVFVCAYRMP